MKYFISLSLLFVFGSATAQLNDALIQDIYYQRYETAKQELASQIQQGNAAPDAYYWLTELHLKEKDLVSAANILQNGMSHFNLSNPPSKDFPMLSSAWAQLLLDSGKTTEARAIMEKLLDATKYKDTKSLIAVARANIESKNGDLSWAITLLEKAVKKDKKNPTIYSLLGDASRKLGDGSNAIQYYSAALEADPHFAEAMYKKGMLYKAQNNTEVYVERFHSAYAIDSMYVPAIYQLYEYYFGKDNALAGKMLSAYIRHADPSPEHAYMTADLQFISKAYPEAIQTAKQILEHTTTVKPRLYKLLAYSLAETNDSAESLKYMQHYFATADTGTVIARDYTFMANLSKSQGLEKSVEIGWLEKALSLETDATERLTQMQTLADLEKENGNRLKEADWREKIYTAKYEPGNLDIYKWGMALYAAEKYGQADSVFGIYASKYPDQIYGYLWQARCSALLDSNMEKGLAIPHYKNLVQIASKDSIKNKSTLLSAYGYLGSYEANTTRNFPESLYYFNKILELEPENKDALKYKNILEVWIAKSQGSDTDAPGNQPGK